PGTEATPKVGNYLALAILTTFLCAPLGVMGIINSSRASNRLLAHDVAGARRASRRSLAWCLAGLVFGLLFLASLSVMAGLCGGSSIG
ncbi:CD225/dispanin family protein, partial [Frankia casuarinae]